jgi:REP element-mobilizing transposase RayT
MERYRIVDDGAVYFVTFSIVEWLPVFVAEPMFRIVTNSLNFCHRNKALRINAYVIMPTHLHAIVFDAEFRSDRLKSTLDDFRKFTGRQLCDQIDQQMPSCFSQVLREAAGPDRERRCWQPSRHPELLFTERFWQQKFDYVHENPYRKGLVRRATDWRFSSASSWLLDRAEENDVLLSGLEW